MAPSIVYTYFILSDGNPMALCKLCNKSIVRRIRGSSFDSSNLLRHLHRYHPNLPTSSKAEVTSDIGNNYHPSPISTPISTPQNFPTLRLNSPQSENVTSNNNMSCNPNEINLNVKDLKLIHPFSLIVSGPTSSGKSTLLFQILDNLHQNTTPKLEKIVYIYGIYQDIFKNYPNIFFTDDLNFMDLKPEVPTVIILDDLMSVLNNSKKLEELFTRGVHHRKVSVVLTLQNLFYHGGVMKTLRDNAMYIALTKHIQDVSKLDTFARQLESKNSNYFKDSYADAVSKKYGYLFCDLHPHSELRDGHFKIKYRSLIHKPDGQVLYLPKSQGMKKAVIQSGVLDTFGVGQVKALIKSGPTLPDSFKSPGIPSAVSTLIPYPKPVQKRTDRGLTPHPSPPLTQYTSHHNVPVPASINPTSLPTMQSAPLHHPKTSLTHTTPEPPYPLNLPLSLPRLPALQQPKYSETTDDETSDDGEDIEDEELEMEEGEDEGEEEGGEEDEDVSDEDVSDEDISDENVSDDEDFILDDWKFIGHRGSDGKALYEKKGGNIKTKAEIKTKADIRDIWQLQKDAKTSLRNYYLYGIKSSNLHTYSSIGMRHWR